MNKQKIIQLALLIGVLILLNVVGANVYKRFDLTKEKRFSLTDATKTMLEGIDDIIYVEVLLEGELNSGFKRLQRETLVMLNEFKAYAGVDIEYRFLNPLEDLTQEEQQQVFDQLAKQGIMPTNVIDNREGYSEKPIYPWAIITYKGRSIPVELLQKQLNKAPEVTLNNSVSLIEYNLANAMQKLLRFKKPTVAFLEGHGELGAKAVEDIARDLSRFYVMERFDLTDNLYIPPRVDVLIIAKPTQKYEEVDKFKIDQYVMNGGKVLWLIENLNAELDSLMTGGKHLAMDYSLNIEDLLFKYGVRINYDLVQDVQCTQIPLTLSKDRQMSLFDWTFFPVVTSPNNDHPVSKNLDAILFRFAGSIDTIRTKKEKIKKTILLQSSPNTRVLGTPAMIDVSQVKEKPLKESFNSGSQILAVALEGEFPSPFKNRLSPNTIAMIDTLEDVSFKEKSNPTKMVVISDGDIIQNEIDRASGRANPLGYYKFSKQNFANKDLLLNAVEWLNDENGIIEARSKDLKLRLLDDQRVKVEKTKWQLINIVLPILLLLLFGGFYNWIRKKKYA